MALEIVWSKKADRTFDSILEYLSSDWGDSSTKSFVKKVYAFLDVLVEFPGIGTIENKEKEIRGFPITKHLVLFYQIRGNRIILLDFFDTRQNPAEKDIN